MLDYQRKNDYEQHIRKYGIELVAETAKVLSPKVEYEQLELELEGLGVTKVKRRRRGRR
jgi:hypothetical protein